MCSGTQDQPSAKQSFWFARQGLSCNRGFLEDWSTKKNRNAHPFPLSFVDLSAPAPYPSLHFVSFPDSLESSHLVYTLESKQLHAGKNCQRIIFRGMQVPHVFAQVQTHKCIGNIFIRFCFVWLGPVFAPFFCSCVTIVVVFRPARSRT